MTTVNLDFELLNEFGEPIGNAAFYCAGQIQSYINEQEDRGFTQIADWCKDYQSQLNANKYADMFGEQYEAVKKYYTSGLSGLYPVVLSQITDKFVD